MFPASAIPPMISSYGPRPGTEIRAPELDGLQQGQVPSETSSAQPAGNSFASVLGRMVEEVNAKQGTATDAVAALQSGQNVSLHQAVIAMEEANISFQLMVEVRNKLLESYQELMRMQV
jgi:flagellar hook-basal body complex protein FliE